MIMKSWPQTPAHSVTHGGDSASHSLHCLHTKTKTKPNNMRILLMQEVHNTKTRCGCTLVAAFGRLRQSIHHFGDIIAGLCAKWSVRNQVRSYEASEAHLSQSSSDSVAVRNGTKFIGLTGRMCEVTLH